MKDATLVSWLVERDEPVTLDLVDEFYRGCGVERPRNASFEALRRLTQRGLVADGAITAAAREAALDALCAKVRFASQEAAERALADGVLSRSYRRRECRAYFHDRCGGWHLTSKPRYGS